MKLIQIHNPENGVMRIIGFMSGTGSNLRKVIEHEHHLIDTAKSSPYHVCAIFSDNCESAAPAIGRDYDLPVVIRDIGAFYKTRGVKKSDLCLRPTYDAETVKALEHFGAQFAVFAGYMSIASNVLIEAFTGINVHPGDLSVVSEGKRKWTGDKAVQNAIITGETSIRSTTHLVESEVDGGKILMISKPLPVRIPQDADLNDPEQLKSIAKDHQGQLKQMGDWEILPLTLEYLGEGRYSRDNLGNMYFDSKPVPDGVRQ